MNLKTKMIYGIRFREILGTCFDPIKQRAGCNTPGGVKVFTQCSLLFVAVQGPLGAPGPTFFRGFGRWKVCIYVEGDFFLCDGNTKSRILRELS